MWFQEPKPNLSPQWVVSSPSQNFTFGQVDLGGLRTDLAIKLRKRRVWILQHFPHSLSLGFQLHSAAGPYLPYSYFCLWCTFLLPFHLSCQVHLVLIFGFTDAMPKKPGDTLVFLLGMYFFCHLCFFFSLSEVLCSTNLASFYCF